MSRPALPYTKASGCGNVFLLVEQGYVPEEERAQLTVRLCDGKGIGADGVEWISASKTADADVEAILINADGSSAEISGNGTRCVAAHWIAKYGGDKVRVRTGAGIKECRLVSQQENNFEFEMTVGVPRIEGPLTLKLPSGEIQGTKLSMGNPQFVVFVADFDFDWRKRGAEIQGQKTFSNGTNVDFVRVINSSEVEARFFERGVGETQSSGTGSCASAVAAIASGKAKSPVRVVATGGAQIVTWETGVLLRGPARIEQQGTFSL